MAVETKSRIAVPRTQIYPVGVVSGLGKYGILEFEGEAAREMDKDSFGKSYKDIHSDSIVLADQAVLWNMYLMSELGKLKLPEDVKGVLDYLFNQRGRGNVTNDACDYNKGDKGLKKVKPTDRSVRWVKKPVKFERKDDKWEAIGGEEYFILIPEPGYVELTNDGAYNPITGTPFSIRSERRDAEKSYTARGFSPEFAKKAVAYFYSRNEGEGTSAVARRYYVDDSGRFGVDANGDPDYGNGYVGSFSASRSPSGARHDSEKDMVTVSEADFQKYLDA